MQNWKEIRFQLRCLYWWRKKQCSTCPGILNKEICAGEVFVRRHLSPMYCMSRIYCVAMYVDMHRYARSYVATDVCAKTSHDPIPHCHLVTRRVQGHNLTTDIALTRRWTTRSLCRRGNLLQRGDGMQTGCHRVSLDDVDYLVQILRCEDYLAAQQSVNNEDRPDL